MRKTLDFTSWTAKDEIAGQTCRLYFMKRRSGRSGRIHKFRVTGQTTVLVVPPGLEDLQCAGKYLQ
jgi:hypothetical protein